MATQLTFNLRTSSCKTVHLLGSWDSYQGQLPMSKDSSVKGGWRGTFRFQASTLTPGQRYWYYYIIDGYHVSHDPAQESVVEPTTSRRLNVLDVPEVASTSSSRRSNGGLKINTDSASMRPSKKSSARSPPTPVYRRHSRNTPADIPLGLPLDPSDIVSPAPHKPGAHLHLTTSDLSADDTVERLTKQFARYAVRSPSLSTSDDGNDSSDIESDSDLDSDAGSDVPSLVPSSAATSPRSASHSPRLLPTPVSRSHTSSTSTRSSTSRSSNGRRSAASSTSGRSSVCTCERYGRTRRGDKLKLDCGGSRCGYSHADDDSDCSSIDDDSSSIASDRDAWNAGELRHLETSPALHKGAEFKRHGVVLREPTRSRRSRH